MAAARKITLKEIADIDKPGRYRADDGLYLNVAKGGTHSWIFLYQLRHRRREMGLGRFPEITLPKARALALEARQKVASGIDPLDAKAAPAGSPMFRDAATQFIASNKAGWSNAKHAAQWTATLETYAFPTIGKKSVADIDVSDIRKILEPIWSVKTETATRVRQRIERVLDWARVQNFRRGENPARWKGHLEFLLPPAKKTTRVVHRAALPYPQVPAFMAELRTYRSVSAAALGLAILTCSRTEEIILAKWSEIDLRGKVWTRPPEHMKAGREHRVPLTTEMLVILRLMRRSPHQRSHLPWRERQGRPIEHGDGRSAQRHERETAEMD